jgi:hypothetical protein
MRNKIRNLDESLEQVLARNGKLKGDLDNTNKECIKKLDELSAKSKGDCKVEIENSKECDVWQTGMLALQHKAALLASENKRLTESLSPDAVKCAPGDCEDYKKLTLEIALQQKLTRALWQPSNLQPIQKVVIITDIFNPPIRINEPLITLQANLLNYFVESIVLLHTPDQDISWKTKLLNHEKLVFHQLKQRFTPGDAIEYANKNLKDKIVVMTNNDIMFDNTLINMRNFDKTKKTFWSLSRRRSLFDLRRGKKEENIYYYHQDLCFPYFTSHDAYIWSGHVESSIQEDLRQFHLGEWGCENRIIWNFKNAQYSTANPCSSINLWHYQSTYYPKPHDKKVNGGKTGAIPSDPIDPSLGFSMTWDPKMTIVRA